MTQKQTLRARMRGVRREHVAALPDAARTLMFLRPPTALATLAPEGSVVGLYRERGSEAPSLGYAKWLYEHGRRLALPWFADRDAPMRFRSWNNPYEDSELQPDPFGGSQPTADAEAVVPRLILVPLLAFTADCERLGQGGGHYDRWLAAHPDVMAVGLGWDCQLVEALPAEPHDRRLRAVITPTRMYAGED